MLKPKSTEKLVIIVILLIIIGVVSVYFSVSFYSQSRPIPTATPKTTVTPDLNQIPRITYLSPNISPIGFPEGIYAPNDARWIEASKYEFPDGRVAYTRTYETSLTVSEIFTRLKEKFNNSSDWTWNDSRAISKNNYFILLNPREPLSGALIITIKTVSLTTQVNMSFVTNTK